MTELNKKRKWTVNQVNYLKGNYKIFGPEICANYLNRSTGSVKHQAVRLGLSNVRRVFTELEIKYIKKHYKDKGPIIISKDLGVKRDSVCGVARRFGLKMKLSARGEISRQKLMGHKVSKQTRDKIGKANSKPQNYCIDCGKEIGHRPTRCNTCSLQSRGGEGHMWWNGGVTSLYQLVAAKLYPAWKYPILCRDHFTCQRCGRHDPLEVHHLRLFTEIREIVMKQYPELSLKNYEERIKLAQLIVLEHKLEDGITLCYDCHKLCHFEKRDELLETPEKDNQQPSLSNVVSLVDRKVQRLTLKDTQTNNRDTSVPTTYPKVV